MAIEQDGKSFAAIISAAANETESVNLLTTSHKPTIESTELSETPSSVSSASSPETQINGQSKARLEVGNFFDLAVEEIAALRTRAEVDAIEAAASLILEQEKLGGRVHITG